MNGYDVAIPSSSYSYLDWRHSHAGPKDIKSSPSHSRGVWYHYVLASEDSQNSDDGSETTLSIQGKETDVARDTSDLEWASEDESAASVLEFEVATSGDEVETGGKGSPLVDSNNSSSNEDDDDIIKTRVIHAMLTEGDIMFADSEDSLSAASSDSELSPFDYWNCAQCRNANNNPMFRYCEKCYKVRKDFFPPRPKRKRPKRKSSKKQRKTVNGQSRVGTLDQVSSVLRMHSRGTDPELLDIGREVNKTSPVRRFDFESIKVPSALKSECTRAFATSDVGFIPKSPKPSTSGGEEGQGECLLNVDDKIDLSITIGAYKRVNDSSSDNSGSRKTKRDHCDLYDDRMFKKIRKGMSDVSEESTDMKTELSDLSDDGVFNDNKQDFCNLLDDDAMDIKSKFCNTSVIKKSVNKNIIVSESFKAQSLLNLELSDIKNSRSFSQPVFSHLDYDSLSKTYSEPAVKFSKDDMALDDINHGPFSDGEKLEANFSKDTQSDMCITCLVEPKSGVFVHGRIAHICCCYKCSVKVWMKTKRCPICNCKVSNVLKAFVM